MPRFPEESVTCLKRTMLARSPSFVFTAGDVEAIVSETGLIKAQVQVWADHFRMRYETEQERKNFLESDGVDKEKSVKMSRYFITCFNVTPDFATNFKFQKSKGQGEFGIKYMEAVFNKEAESGEFFIEFEDYVWEHKLIESFQSQGAGQVTTITFANNDGGDSATNALVRILKSQKKTQDVSHHGTCPPALLTKVKAKQAEGERQDLLDSAEFKEKSDAAMKESLAAQVVKLEGIDNKVQSQAIVMEDIKHGVCDIIPELQAKNANLVKEVTHHILQRDIQEAKTATQTRKVNEKDAEISALHKREEAHLKKIEQLEKDSDVSKAVENLKEMLQLIREEQAFARAERADNARCAADNARCAADNARCAEYLASMINQEEERAAKRPRV